MTNSEMLQEFIATLEIGQTAIVATSQYAANTVQDGFHFDFWSTASAVRGAIQRGLITGESFWRYYEIMRIK